MNLGMHAIEFVDDLPDGHDFLFVAIPDGALVFYRGDAVEPRVLEDSWAASRAVTSATAARRQHLSLVAEC